MSLSIVSKLCLTEGECGREKNVASAVFWLNKVFILTLKLILDIKIPPSPFRHFTDVKSALAPKGKTYFD
jgi:hypothetical protein